jgi:site-specific recombinase XerC
VEELGQLAVQYIEWITTELGYSISSANLTASALTSFFLTSGMEPPELSRQKQLRKRPQVLDSVEEAAFLSVVQNCRFVRDRLIAKMFLYAGLRVKECYELMLDDVICENGTYRLVATSRSSSKVIMEISPDFQDDLEEWLRIRAAISTKEQALFVTRSGSRLSVGSITFVVRRLGLQARMVLAPQILRNTCLSKVASQTPDLHVIAAAGGFRTLDSARRYATR